MADKPSASEFSTDTVHIEQLELFAHVGVPDHERHAPQRITVTVTAVADLNTLGDDIRRSVDSITSPPH